MTAKQYLSRAYGLRRRIAAKLSHLEELRTQAEHITPTITGLPKGNLPGSPVERAAADIADLTWEIDLDYLDLLVYQEEIRKTIEAVEDPAANQVLSYRYLSYKTWSEIEDLMHYSRRQLYRIHAKGLRIVDDVIECHHTPVI